MRWRRRARVWRAGAGVHASAGWRLLPRLHGCPPPHARIDRDTHHKPHSRAAPHMGSAYSTIAADSAARFQVRVAMVLRRPAHPHTLLKRGWQVL